jgi:acetyl-CoA acyltransferase
VPQGIAAERIAAKWKLGRDEQDEFSAASHQRAAEAARSGGFDNEIVPIAMPDGSVVTADETIRPDTTPERLAGLKPAFATQPYLSRYPELTWSVTAGNSSQITDGAAALLLASAPRAAELGRRPRARIVASSVVGDDPELMLTGPIPATHKVLQRAGLSISDMDAIEINEAFAPVPLAWQAEFNADPARVNPRGGAIALGHPLGASGARLLGTLINHLEQTDGRYGLVTMCEAGGMANATIIERVG